MGCDKVGESKSRKNFDEKKKKKNNESNHTKLASNMGLFLTAFSIELFST